MHWDLHIPKPSPERQAELDHLGALEDELIALMGIPIQLWMPMRLSESKEDQARRLFRADDEA